MDKLNTNILGIQFTMDMPVFSNKLVKSLFTLIMIAAIWGMSWLVCVLMIKGICWCFDISYSIKFAIGIWLTIMLIQTMVNNLQKP